MRFFIALIITLCQLFSCSLFAQFSGGAADGAFNTIIVESTLFGSQLSSRPLFLGGSGDGTDISSISSSLNETVIAVVYQGGSGDGFSLDANQAVLNGTELVAIYGGGSGDGFSLSANEVLLDGTMLAAMFGGGSGDGFSLDTYQAVLNGMELVAIYGGGSGDGFSLSANEVLLDGTMLATMFGGGSGDGEDVVSFSAILSGTDLAAVFLGGSGDGATKTLYEGPLDIELPDISLPVELLFFDAIKEEAKVRLEWETITEIQNDYFIIQRTKHFDSLEEIKQIPSKGNGEGHQYITYDDYPLEGLSYYRLKQLDFDGAASYSEWRTIDFKPKEQFEWSLYPNPSFDGKGLISLSFTEHTVPKEIQLFDSNGRMIWRKPISTAVSTDLEIPINIEGYHSGTYFVKLILENKDHSSLKWIVINPE